MLLILKTSIKLFTLKLALLISLSCSLYFSSWNANAYDESLKIHGFVAQGLIDVNGSTFVNDDGELSAELTELGISASYQLNDSFRLAGQAVYLDGGNRYAKGLRVDYALLDWLFYDSTDWQVNLYLGRYKNNHWLHSSTRDIPFARPTIILPQSVYFDGFRDFAMGGDGGAIKVSHSNDDYGNFDFNFSYGSSSITDEQAKIVLSDLASGSVKQDFDTQASLYWQPAYSPWRFGLSFLKSDFIYKADDNVDFFHDGLFSFQFSTFNALYEGENWEFSSEIYQTRFITEGFYNPAYYKAPISQGAYIQARYQVNSQINLLARYERFYLDKNDKNGKELEEGTGGLVPAYFGFHNDATVGLTYDFSSNFGVKLEYHWVHGTGRLSPVVLPNPIANNSEHWQMWAVQLMYWF
jgi:hypothetical protein